MCALQGKHVLFQREERFSRVLWMSSGNQNQSRFDAKFTGSPQPGLSVPRACLPAVSRTSGSPSLLYPIFSCFTQWYRLGNQLSDNLRNLKDNKRSRPWRTIRLQEPVRLLGPDAERSTLSSVSPGCRVQGAGCWVLPPGSQAFTCLCLS